MPTRIPCYNGKSASLFQGSIPLPFLQSGSQDDPPHKIKNHPVFDILNKPAHALLLSIAGYVLPPARACRGNFPHSPLHNSYSTLEVMSLNRNRCPLSPPTRLLVNPAWSQSRHLTGVVLSRSSIPTDRSVMLSRRPPSSRFLTTSSPDTVSRWKYSQF